MITKRSKQIGKRIRAQRKRRGMTETRLATLLGVNVSTVSRLERGIIALKFEVGEQIARRIGQW